MSLSFVGFYHPCECEYLRSRECQQKSDSRSVIRRVQENGLHIGFSICRMHPIIGNRQKTARQVEVSSHFRGFEFRTCPVGIARTP